MAAASGGELDIGDLYSRSLRLIGVDPAKLLGLSALGLAPSWLADRLTDSPVISFGILLLSLPLLALTHGGVVVLLTRMLEGGSMSWRDLLSGPSDGLWRITLALVLIGIVIAGGFVLFIVPGLVALAFFWVAWPIVVLESAGGPEALRRSAAMTDGSRLKIVGATLLLIAINFGFLIVQMLLIAILGLVIGQLAGLAIGAFTTALALGLVTLSYHQLKNRPLLPVA